LRGLVACVSAHVTTRSAHGQRCYAIRVSLPPVEITRFGEARAETMAATAIHANQNPRDVVRPAACGLAA
jgi:hypothetical protein